MNKRRVLVIPHIPNTTGNIVDAIKEYGFEPDFAYYDEKESFPALEKYKALIVMGGMEGANSTTQRMRSEIQLIRKALKLELPYFGVCLGMQQLVKAAGGKVIPSQRKEIGFRYIHINPDSKLFTIKVTEKGEKDPIFKGLENILAPIFQLHIQTVNIKNIKSAKLLGTDYDNIVPNQFIKIGKSAYGMQGHFEITPEVLEVWLQKWRYPKMKDEDKKMIRFDYINFQKTYNALSKKLFKNFFSLIK